MSSRFVFCMYLTVRWGRDSTGTQLEHVHTAGPADDLILQRVDSVAEGEEDAVYVPFFQPEGGGHGAVAETSGEQSE